MEHFYAMIMAGGGGKRLWPMSRRTTPKQLLPLVGEDSMFKVSVDRLGPLFPPENIYVVTGEIYVDALRAQAPDVPEENFIVEPYGKDSGPAAALGVTVIQKRDPEAVIAILTADHHISETEKFRNVLTAACEIAVEQDFVVTLGISPSHPSTGFGYIQRGNHLGDQRDFNYYLSVGFHEKPRADLAVTYLKSGNYSWNSGMFIWTAKRAMAEFQRQRPAMHRHLMKVGEAVDTPQYKDVLTAEWEHIEKISLDYAVMENAEKMCVIPIDIGWSDVGSWGALYDILELDSAGNAFQGRGDGSVVIDTQETLIYSDRLVVTVGVRDVVIIDTEDAVLICHKDRTQEVRDVVKALDAQNKDNYL
ncbi:MAG: mannose-1-phosphate guanylyltransferase [Chloroflexota bacterium]